eukprot:jgi/Ulvmu1/3422/UM016_0041.1
MVPSLQARQSACQAHQPYTRVHRGGATAELKRRVHAHGQKTNAWTGHEVLLATAIATTCLVAPDAAVAGESISPELADAFQSWLDTLQDLGPLGPAAFVASMAVCECIPFFPTQPLSIAAGLLFGAGGGAALNLLGLCTASTLAFTLSRTAFRGVAEAVVKAETGGEEGADGSGNPVKQQIEKAQQLIENGGPGQQFTAILLLRLTPIVPFSASNYVLGLTPVPYPPFIGATIVGMAVWSTLLASLGAAGRTLLTSGADFSEVLEQVSAGAGGITRNVLIIALAFGAVAAIAVTSKGLLPDPEDLGRDLRGKGATSEDEPAEKARRELTRQSGFKHR